LLWQNVSVRRISNGGFSLAALAGVLVWVIGVSPLPASAHQICISKSVNGLERGVACNRYRQTADHRNNIIDGCDRSRDGLRVRAWWVHGDTQIPGNFDPNGADSGCANDFDFGDLDAHFVCIEQPVGCSGRLLH